MLRAGGGLIVTLAARAAVSSAVSSRRDPSSSSKLTLNVVAPLVSVIFQGLIEDMSAEALKLSAMFAPESTERARLQGVVRVPRRVFQRLLSERPTPERCVEAYYLQRTRFESIAERKLRRRQLTEITFARIAFLGVAAARLRIREG